MGVYMIVAGWTREYLWLSLTGTLHHTRDFSALFSQLTNDPARQIFWMTLFVLGTAGIIAFGVKKGIELSSKLMMPLLLLVLLILCGRALSLPGASEGLVFLFEPSIENARSAGSRVFLDALGQSFFSLSIGMGCLMTYASYFGKDVRLAKTAGTIAAVDTGIAVLAGVIIFPTAFALAEHPETMVETLKTGGPGLIFIAVPQLLQSLPVSQLWSILFFVLLVLATLTSTISLLEVITAFVHEEVRITLPKRWRSRAGTNAVLRQEYRIARPFAAFAISIGIIAIGVVATFSLADNASPHLKIFGLSFFDVLDFLTAKLMMPLGGIFIALFAGWRLDKAILAAQLSNDGKLPLRFFKIYRFFLRYVAPAGIAVILIFGLIS